MERPQLSSVVHAQQHWRAGDRCRDKVARPCQLPDMSGILCTVQSDAQQNRSYKIMIHCERAR